MLKRYFVSKISLLSFADRHICEVKSYCIFAFVNCDSGFVFFVCVCEHGDLNDEIICYRQLMNSKELSYDNFFCHDQEIIVESNVAQ